jgi:hypothetical protein
MLIMKNFLKKEEGFSIPILVMVIGIVVVVVFFNYQSLIKEYHSSIIKDNLTEARVLAKVYHSKQKPVGYTASTMLNPDIICTGDMFDGKFDNNLDSITGDVSVWPKGTTLSCQATSLQYAISASLPTEEGIDGGQSIWCVDSTGRSMWVDYPLAPGDTNCN